MIKCSCCKKELDNSLFVKNDNFQPIIYYKLCFVCREKGRISNNRRKDKKSAQSKEYYAVYKKNISENNKEWRKHNKEKLKEYEHSPERKNYHKQWREKKRKEDRYRFVWYAAKRRAKNNKVLFNITKQDIIDICPKDNKCPILGITLEFGNKKSQDNSPSLDRIIPQLGYVAGNILLISYRANRIKNDSTFEELEKIYFFFKKMEKK